MSVVTFTEKIIIFRKQVESFTKLIEINGVPKDQETNMEGLDFNLELLKIRIDQLTEKLQPKEEGE